MIKLNNIKSTDTLGQLRGQINTMVDEINTMVDKINTMADEINSNQMVVGQVLNPRVIISYYHGDNLEVDASLEVNQLFALCMLKSNSVYIAQVFGTILGNVTTDNNSTDFAAVAIVIPSVKLPNRTAEVSSFLTPSSLGFTEVDSDAHDVWNAGVQFGLTVLNSNGSTSVITTNPTLDNSSTDIILNSQNLMVTEDAGAVLALGHVYLNRMP